MTDTVAVPYHADIIGPFSNKRGGIVYVTAYAEQTDAFMDPVRWGADRGDPAVAAQGLLQARGVLLPRRHPVRAALRHEPGSAPGRDLRRRRRRDARRSPASTRGRPSPRRASGRAGCRSVARRAAAPEAIRTLRRMQTREMLRQSWRAWLQPQRAARRAVVDRTTSGRCSSRSRSRWDSPSCSRRRRATPRGRAGGECRLPTNCSTGSWPPHCEPTTAELARSSIHEGHVHRRRQLRGCDIDRECQLPRGDLYRQDVPPIRIPAGAGRSRPGHASRIA